MWPRSISQQPLIADRKLLFPFFPLFKCLQHGQAFNQTRRASLLCCRSSEENMNVLKQDHHYDRSLSLIFLSYICMRKKSSRTNTRREIACSPVNE